MFSWPTHHPSRGLGLILPAPSRCGPIRHLLNSRGRRRRCTSHPHLRAECQSQLQVRRRPHDPTLSRAPEDELASKPVTSARISRSDGSGRFTSRARPSQFLGECLTKGPGTLPIGIAEEAGMAMPVVVPARIVQDGIKTDPVDRDAGLACRDDLMTDDAEPCRAHVALNPILGLKQRAPVALVDVTEEVGEGAILWVIDCDRQIAI